MVTEKKVCKHVTDSYKYYIGQLESSLKKNNSWFDKNRGTIGMLTGLVVGVGVSIGIVHAVYPQ